MASIEQLISLAPWGVVLIVFIGMLALQWKLAGGQHDLATLLAQALAKQQPVSAPPTVPSAVSKPVPAPTGQPVPKPAPVPVGPPVSIHDSPQIAALKTANAQRWAAMHVKADLISAFDRTAVKLCAPAAKVRYEKISATTGVPWGVVAVIHEREAAGNFNAQLGQGDPLGAVSVHVPTGRGPFLNHPNDPPGEDAFYRGALDALTDCGPFAAKWKDWSIGGLLTLLEEYNGLGYANRGVPSAYVWSGSDQYEHGKFVADHVYSETAVDVQQGCAPLLSRMAAIDNTVFLQPQT